MAIFIEEVAFDETSEGEDVFRAGTEPAHAGEFGALSNDMTTGPLDGARTDEVALAEEGSVGHPRSVGLKVGQFRVDRFAGESAQCASA